MGAKRWGDAVERVATENGILVKTHQEYTITDWADLEEINTDYCLQGSIVLNIPEHKFAFWDGESSWIDSDGEAHEGGNSMSKIMILTFMDDEDYDPGTGFVKEWVYDEELEGNVPVMYTYAEVKNMHDKGNTLLAYHNVAGSAPVSYVTYEEIFGESQFYVCLAMVTTGSPATVNSVSVTLDATNGYTVDYGN